MTGTSNIEKLQCKISLYGFLKYDMAKILPKVTCSTSTDGKYKPDETPLPSSLSLFRPPLLYGGVNQHLFT